MNFYRSFSVTHNFFEPHPHSWCHHSIIEFSLHTQTYTSDITLLFSFTKGFSSHSHYYFHIALRTSLLAATPKKTCTSSLPLKSHQSTQLSLRVQHLRAKSGRVRSGHVGWAESSRRNRKNPFYTLLENFLFWSD